ncbi:hypothetical protein DFH11DRAFT_272706 [Phellopilus nigrolimitatus]|nr:hypothetical protein DFH11DRAFT_272706 [Phellopilus nigrolimitatus]
MHRVLQLVELLDNIFSSCDRASNAECARVCKLWADTALNSLWRSLESSIPLFSILTMCRGSPKRIDVIHSTRYMVPGDSINAVVWSILLSYSQRVRYLNIEGNGSLEICHLLIDQLVREHQNCRVLFPNLIELELDIPMLPVDTQNRRFENASKCFSDRLTSLTTNLPDKKDFLKVFLNKITTRCPNIQELKLGFSEPVRTVEDEIASTLLSLKRLKTVAFPACTMTSKIASALSTLPNLKLVAFDDVSWKQSPIEPLIPELLPGAFPSLCQLDLGANLADAVQLVGNANFAARALEEVSVQSGRTEEARLVQEFLSTLIPHAQSIRQICIDANDEVMTSPLKDMQQNELDRITISVLRPLFSFENLTSFTFWYHRMLEISNTDLELLVSNLTRLQHLTLCPSPTLCVADRPRLTVGVLPAIARHRPDLLSLRIYVDCSMSTYPESLSIPSHQFSALYCLGFGMSPFHMEHDKHLVIQYLSHIIPSSCKISAGSFMDNEIGDVESIEKLRRDRAAAWADVGKCVPALALLKEEEKRNKALKDKVGEVGK